MGITNYTAKHVHRCFPWISGTTLYERVKAKVLPVANKEKPTSGQAYEFTLAQLVHVGVVDELAAIGAWQAARKVVEIEIEYCHQKGAETDYAAGPRPTDLYKEPPYYYDFYNFLCYVTVDIFHYRPVKGTKEQRLKRSDRIYRITYCPGSPSDRDSYQPRASTFTVYIHKGLPTLCLTSAVIDVYKIYYRCVSDLGLKRQWEFPRVVAPLE